MTGILRLRNGVAARGYEIVTRLPGLPLSEGPFIMVKGSAAMTADERRKLQWRTYSVALLEPGIFIDLARTPCSPEGALTFVSKWGLPVNGPTVPLNAVYRAINVMCGAIESGKEGGDTAAFRYMLRIRPQLLKMYAFPSLQGPLGPLCTRVEWERRGDKRADKPQLVFEAQSLLQFCLLELLQAIAGGIDIKVCRSCGKYLRIPKGGGRPAQHCDDACRQAAHRAKKAPSMSVRSASRSSRN